MVECFLSTDPILRCVKEELLKQVVPLCIQRRCHLVRGKPRPLGERGVPVLELGYPGPHVLVGCAALAEDLEELIDLRVSGEEGPLCHHLNEDGTDSPDINGWRVRLGTEEDLGWPVPECDYLVCEWSDGGAERSGKPEVRELEAAVAGDE